MTQAVKCEQLQMGQFTRTTRNIATGCFKNMEQSNLNSADFLSAK